jgi:glycosyltransferase involved in cell wall biosynthesis
MRLDIDASNLREGGGITHLVEMLRAADPAAHGFSQVVVWGCRATLARLEDRPWLLRHHQSALDGGPARRFLWQHFALPARLRSAGCGVLFAPGGMHTGAFHPVVTMSRNMLPFEWRELKRYAWSMTGLRLLMLRSTQARAYRKADGLIFLNEYACRAVMRTVKSVPGLTAIIRHGVDERFFQPPREQRAIARYDIHKPFRLIYVSIVDLYKHQWHVVAAVARLREGGLPLVLELVGQAYGPALARLRGAMNRFDPQGEFVRYAGPVPYDQLHLRYAEADLCVFASSCENMPNILLEGMASGLPISCSNRGPMPEVLGDAGTYFDPESPADIVRALREMIESPELRGKCAGKSYARAHAYSWRRCASETFGFLADVIGARDAPAPTEEGC